MISLSGLHCWGSGEAAASIAVAGWQGGSVAGVAGVGVPGVT